MANMFSFFKIFKKKRAETGPQKSSKSSPNSTKPKKTINIELKGKEVLNFRLKTPQKLSEKGSDVKTSNSQISRSDDQKERRIELVGNYLKNEDNQREGVPIKPGRKKSKSSMKVIKTLKKELNSTNLDRNLDLNRNNMNSSLDSIIEMNGNRVIKMDEKLLKSEYKLKTHNKSGEQMETQNNPNENQSSNPEITKRGSDVIDSDFEGLKISESNTSLKRSDKNYSKTNVNSGLVPIRDIDLKTAKCVVCLRLVSIKINITVCSHIFCADCIREWLRFSQHCPQCRCFIWSFGHSIRIRFDRICIRSEKDYRVERVYKNEDNYVDSLGAAYLFDPFLSNREFSKYLNSNIAKSEAIILDFESKLTLNGSVQKNVNIRYRITEENHKLEQLMQKKRQCDESFQMICCEINPQMLSFWRQVLSLREDSDIN